MDYIIWGNIIDMFMFVVIFAALLTVLIKLLSIRNDMSPELSQRYINSTGLPWKYVISIAFLLSGAARQSLFDRGRILPALTIYLLYMLIILIPAIGLFAIYIIIGQYEILVTIDAIFIVLLIIMAFTSFRMYIVAINK